MGGYIRDLRHGFGVFKFASGHVFKGQWVEDEMTYGEYLYPNGQRYVGEFRDEMSHGYGEHFYNEHTVFKGQWRNDEILEGSTFERGKIIFKWKDGKR